MTIPRTLAKFVKIFLGIIVRQHHTVQKQIGLLRVWDGRLRKGLLQYCCNQVWMKNGGWETPCERRFGEPFTGPVIPFGAMVEHHPISAKDLSRFHRFGKKVIPGIFLGYVLYAGRIWKGDILVAHIEEPDVIA